MVEAADAGDSADCAGRSVAAVAPVSFLLLLLLLLLLSLLLFVTPIRALAIHVSGLLTAAVRPVLAPVFLLQQLLFLLHQLLPQANHNQFEAARLNCTELLLRPFLVPGCAASHSQLRGPFCL